MSKKRTRQQDAAIRMGGYYGIPLQKHVSKMFVRRTLCAATIVFCVFSTVGCNRNPKLKGLHKLKDTTATVTISTENEMWQPSSTLDLYSGDSSTADIVVHTSDMKQTINGFGGSFNEKGWEALQLLSEEDRDKVMKSLFDEKSGLGFSICRVPIGASDYALNRYTLNEHVNDYAMNKFSIERDKKHLIPYVRAAMEYQDDLKIWASAWTPPTWMKDNKDFDSGNMLDSPKVYDAYAKYLAKMVTSYQKAGIPLFEVAVQNEPEVLTKYPSCHWTPDQYLTFVKNYLGPYFEKHDVNASIMLGTFNDKQSFEKYVDYVLSDEDASRYISSVGYQWDGLWSIEDTKEKYPDKTIVQTEIPCGNWSWSGEWNMMLPGYSFDRNKPQNDYNYGVYSWFKTMQYFKEGAHTFLVWNMVLDEKGMNLNTEMPWPQNAPVYVDREKKEAVYTPMYYAMKHYAAFVKPGSRYVPSDAADEALAKNVCTFVSPDNELITVLQNRKTVEQELVIRYDDKNIHVVLPAKSWATITSPI